MEKRKKNHIGEITMVVSILCVAILLIYFLSLLSGYALFFSGVASDSATTHMSETLHKVDLEISDEFEKLYPISDEIAKLKTKDEIDNYIEQNIIGRDDIGELFYTNGKNVYNAYGHEISDTEIYSNFEQFLGHNAEKCSSLFVEPKGNGVVPFYVPVRSNTSCDGLISLIPADEIFDLSSMLGEFTSAVVLFNTEGSDGQIIDDATASDFNHTFGREFYIAIRDLTTSESVYADVFTAVKNKVPTTLSATIDGIEYTIAIGQVASSTDGAITCITLAKSDNLVASSYSYLRQIVSISIIAMVALIAFIIIHFVRHRFQTQKLIEESDTDDKVGCPNAQRFRRFVVENVYASQTKRYAILSCELKGFHLLADTMSEKVMNAILKGIADVIGALCADGEFYGYSDNGRFYILYHFTSERALGEKVRLLLALINKNRAPIPEAESVTIQMRIGVYITGSGNHKSVDDMINCATLAAETEKEGTSQPYTLYTEDVNQEHIRRQRIEATMESALENGEFRLFLQPKYNIAHDRIDSAEALVRWFDPKKGTYTFPAEFISQLETNGFIARLDRYMFIQVCEYFKSATEKGEQVYPISVNVSRVTATQEDFLTYYIDNKKKYGIADDFLTLELTESFAIEDNTRLFELVEALHKNGIRCSIDDFGSGYSSFDLLRKVKMDEIKIDRDLLTPGFDAQRDKTLHKMLIDLSQSFGMTVVQEGVETAEQFELIKELGCEVVQGYYYAKPIPLEEYRIFIKTNTSIRYKSRVK